MGKYNNVLDVNCECGKDNQDGWCQKGCKCDCHKKNDKRIIVDGKEEREKYQNALIWCSGSEDFQIGGKARKGWEKICIPLLKLTKKTK